jgi:integrase
MNPARSVTHRREDNNRVRFLTEEEEKNLRKVVQERWATHLPELDPAVNTGIRKGSQYGLTWDMVDWKSRELHIPRTKNEEPLHVPLSDAAISALKAVFESGDGKGRVFKSLKTGDPLENGRHWFDDAVVEAQELSLARLASYVCEPVAVEGSAARKYRGFAGAQEFDDDQALRTSRSEQVASGGVSAWSKRPHK